MNPDSAQTTNTASANRQIARAAGTVMAAFVLSNLAGLLRQILVADAFGTSLEMEAFNAANRVSETLFNLMAGGALASAFIPAFTTLLAQGAQQRAWKLASAVANLVSLSLSLASILAALFPEQIVRYLLAPGFSSDPVKEALTIELLRIQLPSALMFGISGLVMGILNSHQVFFIPALTPAMYQVGMIFGVLFLSPTMGIYGLAWGVVAGAGLHLLLQLPALLRLHGDYSPTLGTGQPDVQEVLRLMLPRLLGVAVVQLNFWINVRLASRQPEGSLTGVVVAFTLMLMPQAAIAQSIAVAAMPTFSAQAALGRFSEMRHSLAASLRGVLLLSLPASLGLILLRFPLIQLLYQRGEFDTHSTELVAWALLWYAAGLVGHSLVEVLARAFYALHDTRTPVLVGALAMSLNIVFSLIFTRLFSAVGWMPHGGLALANSLATGLEMVGLFYLMGRRLKGIENRLVVRGFLQAALGTALMSLVIVVWLSLGAGYPTWLVASLGVALGAGVYALTLTALHVPEVQAVLHALPRWLRSKR